MSEEYSASRANTRDAGLEKARIGRQEKAGVRVSEKTDREARKDAGPVLYKRLTAYCRTDMYPFHMPGHKRRAEESFMAEFPNPFGIDITEIDGFDDLHHAEGILKGSMEWAAAVYGADRTYYLVNGSTCGVLSAISAVCGGNAARGKLLMARNSHKSAYHAAELNGLSVEYMYPRILGDFGIQGGLPAETAEKMLENGAFSAVFVTSPTYEGIVSDIGALAETCHRHGVPLIVDEAHGAHFSFGERTGKPGGSERIPVSALDLGADIVIQSLHKTLPSLTQSALLHVKGSLADVERLEHYLRIFQSSSPSYILMASMERCIEYMQTEGRERAKRFTERLGRTRERLRGLRCLRLLDRTVIGTAGVYDLDPWKLVLSVRDSGGKRPDGAWLAARLRHGWRLETEMYGADYVLAIMTLMDTEDGLTRLEQALTEIDRELDREGSRGNAGAETTAAGAALKASGAGPAAEAEDVGPAWLAAEASPLLTIREALERPVRDVPIDQNAAGRVSGEYVYLYPPGIPVLAPGEVLSPDIIRLICEYRRRQLPVRGLRDREARRIRVLADMPPCET